jgi:hypothetical protein
VTKKVIVGADFKWKDVVIGADLDAVEFACDNNFFLIKNRAPHHHSYEEVEAIWAKKSYDLYNQGLIPFVDKVSNIRVVPEEKLIRVTTQRSNFLVEYEKLHLFDTENVAGVSLQRELRYYRVVDWFDCKGLYDLDFDELVTEDKFVSKIKLFKTLRVDGDQKYLDLLSESFLTESELKNFDYSDTMARFKITSLLKERLGKDISMVFWKRDIFPVYKCL